MLDALGDAVAERDSDTELLRVLSAQIDNLYRFHVGLNTKGHKLPDPLVIPRPGETVKAPREAKSEDRQSGGGGWSRMLAAMKKRG